MVNIDKVATVVGYLTLYPENHNQDVWYETAGVKTAEQLRHPSCGTRMCLAGWAAAIYAPDNAVFRDGSSFRVPGSLNQNQDVSQFARQELGLEDDQAFWLFYTASTSEIIPALRYLVRHPRASAAELQKAVR